MTLNVGDLFRRRRVILILVLVNGLGGVYGFWWYHGQLASTPWYLWPVVPDSPLSATLLGLALLLCYAGRRSMWLEAIACVMVMKYGAWAALVIGQFWLTKGIVVFDDVHLFISHLGMAIEGVIYAGVFRVPVVAAVVAIGWAVVNDLCDYGLGVYPRLQDPGMVAWAMGYAIGLTVVVGTYMLVVGKRAGRIRMGR